MIERGEMMFNLKNILSALCSGFIFALVAGALMSYWVWLEMRVHTWVLCWFVVALFIMLALFFKIKPITFFIGEAIALVLMLVKSPNIFYYNVRDMFFMNTPLSTTRLTTIVILVVMTIVMAFIWYYDNKNKKTV